MTNTDFGTDVSCLPDLDPWFRLQSGPRVLAEALCRRLSTSVLWYCPGYGIDLIAMLSRSLTDATICDLRDQIRMQFLADERVLDAQVALQVTGAQQASITITAVITTQDGYFTMVVAVSQLTLALVGVV